MESKYWWCDNRFDRFLVFIDVSETTHCHYLCLIEIQLKCKFVSKRHGWHLINIWSYDSNVIYNYNFHWSMLTYANVLRICLELLHVRHPKIKFQDLRRVQWKLNKCIVGQGRVVNEGCRRLMFRMNQRRSQGG